MMDISKMTTQSLAYTASCSGDAKDRTDAITELARRLEAAEANEAWLTQEWQRMRKSLNAIAWGTGVDAVQIARDTLAIGTKSANDRAAKAATDAAREVRSE